MEQNPRQLHLIMFTRFTARTGVIKLKLPDDFKVTDDSQYWIHIAKRCPPFENRKQLLKILKEKAKRT
jgi:hypothetical protein